MTATEIPADNGVKVEALLGVRDALALSIMVLTRRDGTAYRLYNS